MLSSTLKGPCHGPIGAYFIEQPIPDRGQIWMPRVVSPILKAPVFLPFSNGLFSFFTHPCATGPLTGLMTAVNRGIRGRHKQARRTFATSLFGSVWTLYEPMIKAPKIKTFYWPMLSG